jgi:ribonuclease PH
MTGKGEFVELQATGERASFSDSQLAEMIALSRAGVRELIEIQRKALSAG